MDIIKILKETKEKVEQIDNLPRKYTVSKGNDNGFEKLIPTVLEKIINPFPTISMETHYGHHFPDIDIIIDGQRYGVELKSRNNGTWTTNGNSVFESISSEDYCEIYLLFGSKEKSSNHYFVRYAPYWQVTSAITVTHSPRFKIDMDSDISVFHSEIEYNRLREMSDKKKVIFLQNYLKENTSGVKWFVPQENESIKPISLNSLDSTIREKVQSEVFVLFPQDLIRKSQGTFHSDYSRCSEYLITTYFYYSSSFRDFFSAGGKWKYKGSEFPRVIKKMKNCYLQINEILTTANDEFKEEAYQSWQELEIDITRNSFQEGYEQVLNYLGEKYLQKELELASKTMLIQLLEDD